MGPQWNDWMIEKSKFLLMALYWNAWMNEQWELRSTEMGCVDESLWVCGSRMLI
jgi:hypothetical protein